MLVTRLMKAIEKNLDNVDYTIDQLAQDAGMSRTDLYRKTQQMLGITPNNFLRNVRIKHAARLLAETDMPVNQVALMVGFQTSSCSNGRIPNTSLFQSMFPSDVWG